MPLFITRDAEGKALGIVLAETADEAVVTMNADRQRAIIEDGARIAVSAVPDNPWRYQLSVLIENSGLSNREFARRVLGRDVRSLARYLGGDIMPPELAEQIMRMTLDVDETTITVRVQR